MPGFVDGHDGFYGDGNWGSCRFIQDGHGLLCSFLVHGKMVSSVLHAPFGDARTTQDEYEHFAPQTVSVTLSTGPYTTPPSLLSLVARR